MERRMAATWHVGYAEDGSLPKSVTVSLWQQSVHMPGIYGLELDTSILSPEECVGMILKQLEDGPPRQLSSVLWA